MQQGHCAYPRNDLISKTAELLEVDISLLVSSLDASIQADNLFQSKMPKGTPHLFTRSLSS